MVDLGEFSLDRMVRAVEKVRERLLRAAALLKTHGVPYAVIGGNAVAAWVSRVDEAAVRNTQDVDILIRREDLERTKVALESAGFIYHHAASVDMFLDGVNGKPRDSIKVHFSGEIEANSISPCPDVIEAAPFEKLLLLSLDAVVHMELSTNAIEGKVNIKDLLEVGLVDSSWTTRLSPQLASRLQEILDNPDG